MSHISASASQSWYYETFSFITTDDKSSENNKKVKWNPTT